MSEFEQDIRILGEKTESNRREFLQTEIETCFIAIERARYEISLGEMHEGGKEFAMAQRGAETIEHFLGQGRGPIAGIEAQLSTLKSALKSLRSELDAHRR